MKFATLIAVVVFSLVAIAHLLRLITQVEVLIGGEVMPMWPSFAGFLLAGILAIALWRQGRSPA
ncbi:MAG TPA: hypothetical protein EYN79_04690 [Planctomycetes bacterium]|nr:hypothetical protein [Planctomycetota bacterium]